MVTGWATAPRAPWKIFAGAGFTSTFDPKPHLEVSTIGIDQSMNVTIFGVGAAPGTRGSVVLYSFDDASSGPYTYWPVIVDVQ
jgi:hypothetical protein